MSMQHLIMALKRGWHRVRSFINDFQPAVPTPTDTDVCSPVPASTTMAAQRDRRAVAVLVLSVRPGGSHSSAIWQPLEGPPQTRNFTGADVSRTTHQLLALDAFEWLYDLCAHPDGGPTDIYVAYGPLRRELLPLAGAFPLATLALTPSAAHTALIRSLDEPPPIPAPAAPSTGPAPRTQTRVVATDASMARHGRGAGIACVDTDGTFAQGFVCASSIAVAELRAIDLAVRTFAHGDLRVLSDSRAALAWLAHPERAADAATRRLATEILGCAATRRVTFEWVRGHEGHALNETADRLAMAARRAREFGQADEVRRRIASQILDDLVAA